MPVRAYLYVVACAVCFAVMGVLAKLLMRSGLPFLEVSFARAGFGAIFLYAYARARGISLEVTNRRVVAIRVVGGVISNLGLFYCLSTMPMAAATALHYTTPLWVAALAWLWLKEPVGHRVIAALSIAPLGVALVFRPGFVEFLPGCVAIGSAMAAAISMIALRQLGPTETPEAVVVTFSIGAAVIVGAIGVWDFRPVSAPQLAMMAAMGGVASAAQWFLTRAFALDRAARVGAGGYLTALVATAFDVVLFGQRIGWLALGGLVLLTTSAVLLFLDARAGARLVPEPRSVPR